MCDIIGWSRSTLVRSDGSNGTNCKRTSTTVCINALLICYGTFEASLGLEDFDRKNIETSISEEHFL